MIGSKRRAERLHRENLRLLESGFSDEDFDWLGDHFNDLKITDVSGDHITLVNPSGGSVLVLPTKQRAIEHEINRAKHDPIYDQEQAKRLLSLPPDQIEDAAWQIYKSRFKNPVSNAGIAVPHLTP